MDRIFQLSGAQVRDPAVETYLATRDGYLGALAAELVAMVRDTVPDALEVMHDGAPTFCVGDAAFAYVAVHKAHVSLGFFNGASIPDPARLLEGSGRWMRHVKLRPGDGFDTGVLRALVAASAAGTRAALASEA